MYPQPHNQFTMHHAQSMMPPAQPVPVLVAPPPLTAIPENAAQLDYNPVTAGPVVHRGTGTFAHRFMHEQTRVVLSQETPQMHMLINNIKDFIVDILNTNPMFGRAMKVSVDNNLLINPNDELERALAEHIAIHSIVLVKQMAPAFYQHYYRGDLPRFNKMLSLMVMFIDIVLRTRQRLINQRNYILPGVSDYQINNTLLEKTLKGVAQKFTMAGKDIKTICTIITDYINLVRVHAGKEVLGFVMTDNITDQDIEEALSISEQVFSFVINYYKSVGLIQ